MHLYPIDGAAHDVGSDRHRVELPRRDVGARSIVGVDPDPANAARSATGRVDYCDALHPYSAGGAYVNMMMDEGQERVRASYRDNYARLAEIKATLRPRERVPRQPEHPAELIAHAFTAVQISSTGQRCAHSGVTQSYRVGAAPSGA